MKAIESGEREREKVSATGIDTVAAHPSMQTATIIAPAPQLHLVTFVKNMP